LFPVFSFRPVLGIIDLGLNVSFNACWNISVLVKIEDFNANSGGA